MVGSEERALFEAIKRRKCGGGFGGGIVFLRGL